MLIVSRNNGIGHPHDMLMTESYARTFSSSPVTSVNAVPPIMLTRPKIPSSTSEKENPNLS